MKKRLGILLTAITILPLATACVGGGTNGADNAENADTLQKIVVNDFENSADMGMLLIGNKLGKVSLQENADYVKAGGRSAKLSVTGQASFGTPYLYQTFDIPDREEYSDFTKNVKMTLWVYNDDAEVHSLRAEYRFAAGTLGSTEIELGAKEWTMLNYEIDRQYLPFDANGDYYSCLGVYFYFDISASGSAYDLYFDELSLYRTEKGFNKSVMFLDEHEICSFDHAYQHSLLTVTDDYFDLQASLSISQDYAERDRDFNLKVSAPAGSTPFLNGGGWPGIEINQTILEMFDFSNYDDSDEFCFDVYSPKENGLDYVWVTFRNSQNWEVFKDGPARVLTKGQWQTIRISVGEINATAERPEEYGFIDTARIMVRWGEFVGEDRVAYFNNFRMELK